MLLPKNEGVAPRCKILFCKRGIKFFELMSTYGSVTTSNRMFKVIALIAGGIFLMTFGVYSLSVANFAAFQWPAINVNWAIAGFVTIVASVVTLGSAFVVSKLT